MGDERDRPVFVTRTGIEIPAHPGPAAQFPTSDSRHWYDYEYGPWASPRAHHEHRIKHHHAGQARPRVVCLLPGDHPYFDTYATRARLDAAERNLDLSILSAGWDAEDHLDQVAQTVTMEPDLVIYVADEIDVAEFAGSVLHTAGIPVVGSNMTLSAVAMRYVVGWTGPDSWAQSRALARRFSGAMGGTGGYAVIGHLPGTSVHLARTYGVVSELAQVAPQMECLAVEPGEFDVAGTRKQVRSILDRFGDRLKGIVSSDDNLIQRGVNYALHDANRRDIICVAHGSTNVGLEFVRSGDIEAITYQSAAADASLAVQAASDWLSGLEVEAARFLPIHVIDRSNLSDFRDRVDTISPLSTRPLLDALAGNDVDETRLFFDDVARRIETPRLISSDSIKGIALQILSELIATANEWDISPSAVFESYESAYKHLVRQRHHRDLFSWLQETALTISTFRAGTRPGGSFADRLDACIEYRYSEPISLKTLSGEFGVSAPYLGRLFRERHGISFTTRLNERRIEKARSLLRSRAVSAKEVGRRVGFSDANYFYLVFKRITGTTVSRFLQGEFVKDESQIFRSPRSRDTGKIDYEENP